MSESEVTYSYTHINSERVLLNFNELMHPSHIIGPFYLHGLTLIPAWISNYTHYNVWDEITYPFLNFNGATVEV